MGALAHLPPAQGISAMQTINVVVLNRWFLGVFVGTAALSGACAVLAVASELPRAGWIVAGALAYIAGTFAVTAARNVPLNNRLANVSPSDQKGHDMWTHYLRRWTHWNHIRTAGAAIATLSFALGALGGPA